MEKQVNFEEALEMTGYGKFNIALLLICGATLYIVNADAYAIGYLLPAAQCDLNLSTSDKGILSSISFVGIISSSHLWGFLSDTRGRKNIIIITLLLSFVCTLLSSFAVNFWMLTVLRFFSGFFISGSSATVYAYLGEFLSPKYRTITITCASIFIAIAIIALPGIAWLVIPQQWSLNILGILEYKSWRVFLVLCSLPSIFVAVILIAFPESPKYLLLRNKKDEALEVLKKIYSYNTGRYPDAFPVHELADEQDEKQKDDENEMSIIRTIWNQTVPLFYGKYARSTFVACALQFGVFAISSGLLLWYPEIVNQLAENERLNSGKSISACEAIYFAKNKNSSNDVSCADGVDTSVFQQNLIIGAAYIVGFMVIAICVNSFGKRNLLLTFLLLSGICGVALCWVTYRLLIDLLFVGLLVLSGICCCILNAAVVDLFPTYLRAMAVSIALMSGRIGSVIASSTIGLLLELNCLAAFLVMSSILIGK